MATSRRLAPRRLALVGACAVVALAGACGPGDPCAGQSGACLALHVSADGAVTTGGAVDSISVDVTGALTHHFARGLASGTSLPVAIALLLPDASGPVEVHVVGSTGGNTVGVGSGSVTVAPGAHASLAVVLLAASASCSDGARDGQESDIDCGGPATTAAMVGCPRCADGASCGDDTDCQSGLCATAAGSGAGTCVSCTDKKLDGSESDVDCGGATCPTCSDGKKCNVGADCTSAYCDRHGTCQEPSCTDGVQNGDESDVDCGGRCAACPVGKLCVKPADCQSLYCDARGQCATPSCNDGVKDGDESDVDCGGSKCSACAVGFTCGGKTDCASGDCWMGRCALAPVLTSLSPTSGPTAGGIGVTITGSNFAAGSNILVTFGGVMASQPSWESSTTVKAVLPPAPAGTVDVTVTLGDGQTAKLPQAFTYTP